MDEFDDLLEGKEEQETSVWEYAPKKVKITSGVLDKAQYICQTVKEIGGNDYEWYGLLVAKENDIETACDIILPGSQDVTGSHVSVTGDDLIKAGEKVKKLNEYLDADDQYRIIGWIHNHGSFDTFHSSTDHRNTIEMLKKVRFDTSRPISANRALMKSPKDIKWKGDRLVIEGSPDEPIIEYALPMDELRAKGITKTEAKKLAENILAEKSMKVMESKKLGFCYSVVVNNRNDTPYSEVAVYEESGVSGTERIDKTRVELDVVNQDLPFGEEVLRAELEQSVKFPKSFWGGFKIFGKSKDKNEPVYNQSFEEYWSALHG